MNYKRYVIGMTLGALLSVSVTASAEDAYTWDFEGLLERGARLVEDYLPEELLEQVELPDPSEWRQFWVQIERTLHSYELVDLAWLRPEAEAALGYLKATPLGEPYADWLLQRMDYLDMAHRVVRSYAGTPEPLRPAPRPGARPTIVPPSPKPPSVRIAPEEKPRMNQTARSPVNWERKMASRPKPARADEFVPQLKPIFAREGVPSELVWLAEVESTFNPRARSPVGAMGLFQFMPATAEQYGLRLSPQDERTHPEKSAQAAAKYLNYLHGRFHSWPLALAAYNAGEGRVGRLLRTHSGSSFEDIAAHLPSETQMYVPKVLATIKLREGVDIALR